MLAKQGQPLCKPSMGSRASGGERCASERLPPSAMRARRWASTPRRPRWARQSHRHCPRFTTRTSKETRTSLRASPSGSSRAPGLPGSGAHRAERRARIPRHQAASTSGAPMVQRWRGLGRSTSRQVARLFRGWTGQPLGGHAITDRPDRRLGFCFDNDTSSVRRRGQRRRALGGLGVYCATTCASCRGKPWSKPSTRGSDERTGFAARPPRRSRCTWCERAIQRARSWASFDATGWVRVLGGVHIKAGRGGARPAGLQSRSRCKLACWASLFSVGQAQRVDAAASTGSRVAGAEGRQACSPLGCECPALGKPQANGSVHVLGGVHVESGREGEGPAGTSPVGDASPTLGKPLLGWASTARWMMGPPWEAGSLGRRADRPAVP